MLRFVVCLPLCAALLVLSAESPARPSVEADLVAGIRGATLRDRPVNARIDEAVSVYLVVRMRGRGRRTAVYSDAPRFVLRGRRHARQVHPLAALGPVTVRWYRVEPRPHHVDTASPNRGNPAYSNARLFGARHGAWIGYDRIEYTETPIPGAATGRLVVRRVRPTHPKIDVHGGLGTMRYKAVLRGPDGSRLAATPGLERRGRGGISPRVLRVTFRSDDSFPGHLRGLFNVPNVFGSAGAGRTHQAELYQGADCADVIVAAAREAGARIAYTSVLGFRRHAEPVTGKLLLRADGIYALERGLVPRKVALRFGSEIRSGDIMLIDYVGFNGSPRTWDHIAVVDRDGGTRGQFDPEDPVLHMGYLYGLTEVPARTEGPAIVRFLRFKPRVRRAMRRHRRRLERRRRARRGRLAADSS